MDSAQAARGYGSSGAVIGLLLVYGAVLCACGIVLAGGGHGTYILLGLAGSPFSLLGIPSTVIAALVQWAALGVAARLLHCRPVLISLYLFTHYAFALYLLIFSPTWRNEWYAPHSNILLAIGLAWYLAGQVFLWRQVVLRSHRF